MKILLLHEGTRTERLLEQQLYAYLGSNFLSQPSGAGAPAVQLAADAGVLGAITFSEALLASCERINTNGLGQTSRSGLLEPLLAPVTSLLSSLSAAAVPLSCEAALGGAWRELLEQHGPSMAQAPCEQRLMLEVLLEQGEVALAAASQITSLTSGWHVARAANEVRSAWSRVAAPLTRAFAATQLSNGYFRLEYGCLKGGALQFRGAYTTPAHPALVALARASQDFCPVWAVACTVVRRRALVRSGAADEQVAAVWSDRAPVEWPEALVRSARLADTDEQHILLAV